MSAGHDNSTYLMTEPRIESQNPLTPPRTTEKENGERRTYFIFLPCLIKMSSMVSSRCLVVFSAVQAFRVSHGVTICNRDGRIESCPREAQVT